MERLRLGKRATCGQIVVSSAVALAVLGAIAALSIDVGHLYCVRARLQNTSDAAALAAAQTLVEARYDGEEESGARSAAVSEVLTMLQQNAEGARCDVLFGAYAGGQFVVAQDGDTAATAVQVVTHRDQDAPAGPVAMFFAPLSGHKEVSVRAAAASLITPGISAIGNDLRPFTIPLDTIQDVNFGETFVFTLPHGNWTPLWEDEEFAPGTFGLLNLDGGKQSTVELVEWIENGYPGWISIDPETGCVWINGTDGVVAALQKPTEAVIGEHIFICVHDEVIGQGALSEFRIVRFAGVTILEVAFLGGGKHITMRLDRYSYVPVCETDPAIQDNLSKIQLVQ